MDYTQGNQSRAAEILGINRATLRKKLKHYYLLD
jgi:Fis family transcriptional regulator